MRTGSSFRERISVAFGIGLRSFYDTQNSNENVCRDAFTPPLNRQTDHAELWSPKNFVEWLSQATARKG